MPYLPDPPPIVDDRSRLERWLWGSAWVKEVAEYLIAVIGLLDRSQERALVRRFAQQLHAANRSSRRREGWPVDFTEAEPYYNTSDDSVPESEASWATSTASTALDALGQEGRDTSSTSTGSRLLARLLRQTQWERLLAQWHLDVRTVELGYQ